MGGPAPPDTHAIQSAATGGTNQQTGYNVGAQYGSMPNTSGPTGGVNYVQTGVGPNGVPQYTAYSSLTPQQQQLLNTYQGTQQEAASGANALLAGANYGGTSPTAAIGDMTTGLTGQMMNKWQQATQPFFTTQQQQLDTQLRNMGLAGPTVENPEGSPAYNNAMRNLQTNQGYAIAGEAAQFEPQAFGQATSLYQMPMQMSEALGGFGAPTSPYTTNIPTMPGQQPANLAAMLGAEVPAYMQPYGAAYQQYGNLMSGLFGLGSAGITGLMA